MSVVEGRGRAWMVAAAIGAAACGQPEANANPRTGAVPPVSAARSSAAQTAAATAGGAITLEFDVPDEYQKTAGSASAVTGFRVGFFQSSSSTAIRTVDFSRETLMLRERTVRVTIPRENIPACADCLVRVQTLARGQASAWSEPVRIDGLAVPQAPEPQQPPSPERPRVERTDRPRITPPRQRQTSLAPADIEKLPSLSESLRKLLPADATLDTELARFRRVQDLALAVVISRDYDIPFTTLSKTLEGPPRVSLSNALANLRRDLDVRTAIRKSRLESRRLLALPERRRNAR